MSGVDFVLNSPVHGVFVPQVRARPRHLLVRLHRRVGREPGERHPPDGPLPSGRRHHEPALSHPQLTASPARG